MKPRRRFAINERQAQLAMRNRRAFTLVELLLVVSLIAMLISILLPTLGKAKEMSRRVVCLSNLRQQQAATVKFGVDNASRLPVDQHLKWGSGIGGGALMMVPSVFTKDPYGNFAGQGILMTTGYLPIDGNAIYCPSFSYPDMQHSTYTGQLGVGFQAGLTDGGGWWSDPNDIPAGQAWLKSAYIYRNFAFAPTGSWRPLSMRSDGNEPIIADHFNFIPAVISQYQHGAKDYMVVTIGGAAYPVHDEAYEIRDYSGGATYNVGHGQLLTDIVWEDFFKN